MPTREVICPVCYKTLGTVVTLLSSSEALEQAASSVERGHINKEHAP